MSKVPKGELRTLLCPLFVELFAVWKGSRGFPEFLQEEEAKFKFQVQLCPSITDSNSFCYF